MPAPTTATGGRAMVNVFDGTRNLYSDNAAILVTARDGNQKNQSREFHDNPSVFFTGLPLFNNFGDDYAFLAAADGYKDAGFFPVRLAANIDLIVDLMLIPKSNAFNFAQAKWSVLGGAASIEGALRERRDRRRGCHPIWRCGGARGNTRMPSEYHHRDAANQPSAKDGARILETNCLGRPRRVCDAPGPLFCLGRSKAD